MVKKSKVLTVLTSKKQVPTVFEVIEKLKKDIEVDLTIACVNYDAYAELKARNILCKFYDEYNIPEEIYKKADNDADMLVKRWYEDKAVFKSLSSHYSNISLGELVTYPLDFVFLKLIKYIEVSKYIIEAENPDKVVVVKCNGLDGVVYEICRTMGIQMIFADGYTPARQSIYTLSFFRGSMRKLVFLLANFLMSSLSHIYRKNESTNQIVMLTDGNIDMCGVFAKCFYQNKNNLNLVIPSPSSLWIYYNFVKNLFSSNSFCTYRTLHSYTAPSLRKHIQSMQKALYKDWQDLRNNQKYKDNFKYGNISLWNLLEDELEYTFKIRLATIIEYIELIKSAHKKEKIDIIILHDDVLEFSRTAVRIGKLLGISSLVILHGILAGRKHRNPLADKTAVWGDICVDTMTERYGISRDMLAVTGNPRFDVLSRGVNIDKNSLYQKIGINTNKGLIIYATQPHVGLTANDSPLEKEISLREVINAMKEFPDKQLVIKLHPSEPKKTYESMTIDRYRSILNEMNSDAILLERINLYELISICELVIILNSTVGLEAMILEKPVIAINLTNQPDKVPYAESGAAIGVHKAEDIVPAIKKALYDIQVRKELESNRKKFVYDYAYIQDGQASKRVADLIIQMIEESNRGKR